MKVDLKEDWRSYLSVARPGSEVVGVIDNGQGQTGALVRYASTGLYVLAVNTQEIWSLDQAKVSQALEDASFG